MRAIDLVIFLMCLNAGFFIVNSLGVFGMATPAGRILTLKVEIAGVEIQGIYIVGAMITAILAASVTVIGTRITRPIGIAVAVFGSLYIFLLADAMAILSEIQLGGVGIPASMILALGAFNIVVFLIGMIQLVTGGMRAGR